jgi:hypothetical protein
MTEIDVARARGSGLRQLGKGSGKWVCPQVGPIKGPPSGSRQHTMINPRQWDVAVPKAQEVYHQILPGPSVQGETTGTTAEEELPWVEGSEEGATW